MNIQNFIELFLAAIEITLLFTAFLVTVHNGVEGAIQYYRIQSILLAFVTGGFALVSLLDGSPFSFLDFWLFSGVVFLPLALAISIKWLLARATMQASGNPFKFSRPQLFSAERVWLQQTLQASAWSVALFLGAVGLSAAVAFGGVFPLDNQQITLLLRASLLVSISLFLAGLLNTASKSDIISQVIGLLTMDHGLYLAVVTIVDFQRLAWLFIAALYFYTFITLSIIVILIPRVRQDANSIDLDAIANGSDLKG